MIYKLRLIAMQQIFKLFVAFFSILELRVLIENYFSQKFFIFKGNRLNYFFHSYNNFGITERTIEIPIINFLLKEKTYRRVLEIGNVTKHYYNEFKEFVQKDTLDKYEIAFDVINMDIKDYITSKKYDFIYSISTFEHMDTDGGRNIDYLNNKGVYSSNAYNYIKYTYDNLLKESGKFVITFPLEYCNSEIDKSFLSADNEKLNVIKFSTFIFYKFSETEWKEINIKDYLSKKYPPKFENVNYLGILLLEK